MTRVPVLFLDLDGTVRHGYDELGRWVNGPEDVRVFDGVPELLRRYKEAGWRIAAVTNQGGVALGHLTRDQLYDALTETYLQCGRAIDVTEFCPHHPDGGEPSCWCRKPRPGLIYQALRHLGMWHEDEAYLPHLSLMVGDREEDRQCAAAAGVPFMDAADWRTGEHLQEIASRG